MHIYAFGSICRGEVDRESDVDVLALVDSFDNRFDPSTFSVYSYARIAELWKQGNPFAWHLALEARLIFSEDDADFIGELGCPAKYTCARVDCAKFRTLFSDAVSGLAMSPQSRVFELSTAFLAIRNIATCYSFERLDKPVFCRDSALRLGDASLTIEDDAYAALVKARVLSTRGKGSLLNSRDFHCVETSLNAVAHWMDFLIADLT